jgi:hypothetical protein
MIVVATHNGSAHLPELMEALSRFGTGGNDVLVLDTGSTCPESISLLTEIASKPWPFKLTVGKTPYKAYDTGAYIHAFRNYDAHAYLFMQDSVRPKCSGWFEAFEQRATFGVGCVPWLIFPMQWNSQYQVDWLIEKCNTNDWPPYGVFGPIFYAPRLALERLDELGYLDILPTCKEEQMAMERVWPTIFNLAGFGIRPVEPRFHESLLTNDDYTHLAKRFALRA